MKQLKRFFDFYLKSSLHVAFMVLCMFEITIFEYDFKTVLEERAFIFFSSLAAYNLVKYLSFFNKNIHQLSRNIKIIGAITGISLSVSAYLFLYFSFEQQFVIFLATLFLVLYTIPLNPSWVNFRNIGSIKIHIVAVCWTLLTFVVPLVSQIDLNNSTFWFSVLQRYLWIILAILPFEIADFRTDSEDLDTLPRVIGVSKTKILGYLIFVLTLFLVYVNRPNFLFVYTIILSLYVYFLATSSVNQSSYRTLFWVEAVPFVGWIILFLKLQDYV